MNPEQMTIPALFEDSVRKYGELPFLMQKTSHAYESITYQQVRKSVYEFAAGLMSLGIGKGDRVALLSEGRNEWIISELSILYSGAVNVPLSIKLNESTELPFRLTHSEARLLIVSGRHSARIARIRNQLPLLELIIVLDDNELVADTLTFKEVINKGRHWLAQHPGVVEKSWQSLSGSDSANICYTSGTTSDPKGIILTHRNYTANVEQSMSLMEVPSWYTTLLILPWDHAFAHTAGIFTMMKAGGSIAAVQAGKSQLESVKNIPQNIKEIKPVFLLSAPSLAKNFRKNIETGIQNKGTFIRIFFQTGVKISMAYSGNGFDKGKSWRMLWFPFHWLFDKLIYRRIREPFGGRLKFFIGGAALLDLELQKFFYAIGIPMFQGYGLSEASPVIACNSEKKHKLGSSGYLVSNLRLKICDEDGNPLPVGQKGEIVIKGENVMAGYWKNQKATEETIRDGWLHTGDLGYMDHDGFLYVLGRFKSLLISDDGEKYSPESIEEALINHSKIIEQCMLFNNQNAYTTALIVLNRQLVKAWIADKRNKMNPEDSYRHILSMVDATIAQFRKGGKYENMFPHRWLPSAFAILDQPFTEENQMLNSTMKMVRGKITAKYSDRIEDMYTAKGKNIYNETNVEMVKRMG